MGAATALPGTGRCPRCGVDGRLYRRPEGGYGLACACEATGAPRSPAAAAERRPRPRRPAHIGPWPFAPAARVRRRELVLWLPRLPRADEGPNGRAWQRRSAARGEWHDLVEAALATLEDRPRFTRARLAYAVYRPGGQVHDRDNLVVSLGKPIQDALVAAGVLPGDGPDVVVATPSIEQRPSSLPWGFVVVTLRSPRSPLRPSAADDLAG